MSDRNTRRAAWVDPREGKWHMTGPFKESPSHQSLAWLGSLNGRLLALGRDQEIASLDTRMERFPQFHVCSESEL